MFDLPKFDLPEFDLPKLDLSEFRCVKRYRRVGPSSVSEITAAGFEPFRLPAAHDREKMQAE
jgi:hypothetical protein